VLAVHLFVGHQGGGLVELGAGLAAGRDRPVFLLCAGHQGGGLGGGAGVAAKVDSVAVLLCNGHQGGGLGGLLLRVLGGLLGHVAGDRHVCLGDPRLAVSLVDVGLGGGLGNLGGRLGEPRLAVSLVNVGLGGLDVLRGVLGGVGRHVHGQAACGVSCLSGTLGISGSFSSP
jgi:hypothetical protein